MGRGKTIRKEDVASIRGHIRRSGVIAAIRRETEDNCSDMKEREREERNSGKDRRNVEQSMETRAGKKERGKRRRRKSVASRRH